MKIGGTDYEIEYSPTLEYQEEEFKTTEYLDSYLPADLVCALMSSTYGRDEAFRQHVVDSLTPFQVVSKLWACSVLSKIIGDDYGRSPFVYPGAWFGQLNALMARRIADYITRDAVLLDLDKRAIDVAHWVLQSDQYQSPTNQVKIIQGDALTFDLSAYSDECAASPIVVWTGIEHFDPAAVKRYIGDHAGAKAVYLLQGTNMPAPDHPGLINSFEELEQYFDGTPIYSAKLKTAIGERFQLVFAT
jgi:hypothetical protein